MATVSILLGIFELLHEQFPTLLDHRFFAFLVARGQNSPSVGRRFLLPRRQTAVSLPRYGGRFGVHFVEIVKHGGNRTAHVVDVDALEAGAIVHFGLLIVLE